MELSPHVFFDLAESRIKSLFNDCTYVWMALHQLDNWIRQQELGVIHSKVASSVTITNPHLVFIGTDTVIEEGVTINGPAWIGNHCQIRQGAYLRGPVIVADHAVVGHCSEIKHSVLLEKACAPHFNYVGDSLLGKKVNLGAGVICANLRLDRKMVSVHVESFNGLSISTGLSKLGAVVGDETQIGCNSVLNPGTLIGPQSLIAPLSNLSGCIPTMSHLKNQVKSTPISTISSQD